jgi:tetratricopeptide (TPR) repeat protein
MRFRRNRAFEGRQYLDTIADIFWQHRREKSAQNFERFAWRFPYLWAPQAAAAIASQRREHAVEAIVAFAKNQRYGQPPPDPEVDLKLSPYNGKSLRGRALAYLKMQALDVAIADYEQALRSEPKKAELLYGRGLARQAKGDTVGAEKDIEAAKEISPSIAALFKRYGVP